MWVVVNAPTPLALHMDHDYFQQHSQELLQHLAYSPTAVPVVVATAFTGAGTAAAVDTPAATPTATPTAALAPTTTFAPTTTPASASPVPPRPAPMPTPTSTPTPAAATAVTRKTRKSPSRKVTGATGTTTTATRSMRDVTCAPSQVLCRYANKKCTNPRAVKRTGGLHTFCAMHRENANRNQRRLDLRKRLQKQALQSSALLDRRQQQQLALRRMAVPGPLAAANALHTLPHTPLSAPHTPLSAPHTPLGALPADNSAELACLALGLDLELALPHSATADALYEPLATPTPLRDEDVSTLITLFASAEQLRQHDALCFDDVPPPREPLYGFVRDPRRS